MQTTLVKQLYRDGAYYFIVCLTYATYRRRLTILSPALRLTNIILVAVANTAYAQLALYFFWALINTVLNRMLITLSKTAAQSRSLDNWKGNPYHNLQPPFELKPIEVMSRESLASLPTEIDKRPTQELIMDINARPKV
ncbi:hypothetical protein BU17DRAFT_80529 [Hysterangium stoloniferum]|nr:hypothetical protein BU17DRAFT_80529 [Hysterangium stoloniferum]